MENGKNINSAKTNEPKRSKPNILSRLFICWICPVFVKGNRRDVEERDLIVPGKKYNSDRQGDKLEKYWFQELEASVREKRKPSLWKALRKAYWLQYMPGGLLLLGNATARTMQPLVFTQLLGYWSVDSTLSKDTAGIYAIILLGLNFIGMMCQHHNNLFVYRFSLKIKVACTSLLFRKLLRLNQTSIGDVAAGKLVNLMSNDVVRFDYAFMFLHQLWLIPLQAAVVLYFLFDIAGYAPFVGLFGVVLILLPVQVGLTKLTSVFRRKTAARTDKRIKLMGEIINGIQVIKMYAWEKPFQAVVKAARNYETKALKTSLIIRSTFLGFMLFTERLILFVTCLTLILSGTVVTATVIYPIQQFFSIIQMNLTLLLPFAIASLSEMFVSLERIQEFLVLDEREDLAIAVIPKSDANNVTFNGKSESNDEFPSQVYARKYSPTDDINAAPGNRRLKVADYSVEISSVSASWTDSLNPSEMTLKNISFRVRPGKLCAVIGPVGSGKSSLLQILLKELPLKNGKVNLDGRLSYACQESWLFPETVRENILFGLPYDVKKYKEVCRVCALLPDFEQFPYGDLSLVGERGVSLSGGQRARINLARAVYREADIYLLDDPLSAVDANVGRLLFEGCIKDYLRGHTVILVTHQVHFLKAADMIVVLNDGAVENIGTYDELAKSGKDFSLLLSSSSTEDITTEKKNEKRSSFNRGISTVSAKSNTEEVEVTQIQEAEERQKGNLKWAVIWSYLKSVQSWVVVLFAFFVLALAQAAATATDYWLSFWTNQVDSYAQTLPSGELPDAGLDTEMGILTTGMYLVIYGGLIATIIFLSIFRVMGFVSMSIRASVNIHNWIFQNLIVALMRFFDTNPSGRVLNRFSKDMGAMDELLPRSFLETIQMYMAMTSVLVLNAMALPWTLIPTFVLVVIFLIFLRWYLNAAQAVRRLEGTTKSPVFGMINSTISGLATIRSSNAQQRLMENFDKAQNLHSSAFYTFLGGSSGFGLYIDFICLVYFGAVLGIFILIDFENIIPVGSVGLAVSQTMVLTMLLQMAARFTADFLGQMTAIERVLEYTELPSEDNMYKGLKEAPKEWPDKGMVQFKNLSMKYGADDPPVLKNLNIEIVPGWKVGVVGRTGAGKSSLISALFRLYGIDGSVVIDGIDTKDISKQDLRAKISIIPQEPVLFSATLRYNLDPFDSYSDDEIWRALEQVELKDSIQALDFKVSEGGSNFSVGQRQLVCLARAVLRSNKILVMDEATANVDPQTDALIQKTIRQAFGSCTVITIAHRLNTIMDSDRVLVMDKGQVAEFDYPYTLLSNPDSLLSFMVRETGEASGGLFEMAKTKYFSDNPQK